MNRRLNELHLRRGRLLERIAYQRVALGREIRPVRAALHTTDRWLACARASVSCVKQHPSISALAVVALFIAKPGRIWRWAKRGFIAWRAWRTISDKLFALGWRVRG